MVGAWVPRASSSLRPPPPPQALDRARTTLAIPAFMRQARCVQQSRRPPMLACSPGRSGNSGTNAAVVCAALNLSLSCARPLETCVSSLLKHRSSSSFTSPSVDHDSRPDSPIHSSTSDGRPSLSTSHSRTFTYLTRSLLPLHSFCASSLLAPGPPFACTAAYDLAVVPAIALP